MKSIEDIPTNLAEKNPVQFIDSSDCGAKEGSEDDFSYSDQIIIRRPKMKTRFNSVFDTQKDKEDHVLESLKMDNDYLLCVDNPRKFAEYLVSNNCLDIYEWLEASMREGICVDKKCNIFYKIEKKQTSLNPRQIENIHKKNFDQRELEIIKQGAQLNKKNKNPGLNQIRDVQILFDQTKFNQEQAKLKIIQEKRRRQHHTKNLKYIRENLPHIFGSNIKIEDALKKIQEKEYDLEPLNQNIDQETIDLDIQNFVNFYYSFARRIEKKMKYFHEEQRKRLALKKAEYKRKKQSQKQQQQQENQEENQQENQQDIEKEQITTYKVNLLDQDSKYNFHKKKLIEDDYELSDGGLDDWKQKAEKLEQKIFAKLQSSSRQSERLAQKRLKQLEDLYKSQPKPFIIVDMDSDSDSDSFYQREGNEAKLRYLQPVWEIVREIQCSIPISK